MQEIQAEYACDEYRRGGGMGHSSFLRLIQDISSDAKVTAYTRVDRLCGSGDNCVKADRKVTDADPVVKEKSDV
jgi:hypothetical protein